MAKEMETTQPQARPCPQDCRMCPMTQQVFCTTKMLFNLSRTVQETSQRISVLELTMDDIKNQLQPKVQEGDLLMPMTDLTYSAESGAAQE